MALSPTLMKLVAQSKLKYPERKNSDAHLLDDMADLGLAKATKSDLRLVVTGDQGYGLVDLALAKATKSDLRRIVVRALERDRADNW